ncbi:MAG: TonB family protein [Acidobacteriia bacterium]|nr:TonB family protein [Terriglobia bacterium]MYG02058.1 TonB family protein [Terriglobia bacterium]MYK09977.1 TonB family protein [Terriglobia bacterium]
MIATIALDFGSGIFDALLGSSVRAIVLVLATWLVLRLAAPQRPAVEHGAWTAVLLGMLLLPLAGLASSGFGFSPGVALESAIPVLGTPLIAQAESLTHPSAGMPTSDWWGICGLLFGLGTVVLLSRHLIARRRIRRLLRQAEPLECPALESLARASFGAAVGRTPPQLVSIPGAGAPFAYGALRPTIVLPGEWSSWSAEKLEAVLLHELAHVFRRDGIVEALAAVVASVFWFHPLAYLLKRRLRALAETACDDHAVWVSRDREVYAQALLEIARDWRGYRTLPMSAMAQGASLGERIERILGKTRFESGLLSTAVAHRLAAVALVASLALSCVTLAIAQGRGVALTGSVQDPSGARVPWASVVLTEVDKGLSEAATAGADGSFRIEGLERSASYQVEVHGPVGFVSYRQALDLTSDARLDVTLAMKRVVEAIVVSGTRPARDRSQPRSGRRRVRVGGNVREARLVHHFPATYPPDAEREGVTGTAVLEAVIGTDGNPASVAIVNSIVDGRLADAAAQAVTQWRYEPALLNGRPVEVTVTIRVAFELP